MYSSQLSRLLKNLAFLPLCLAIAACGGGGSSDEGESQQPPTNAAPSAVDDALGSSNQTVELTVDVLANDSDSDGDTLTITSAGVSDQGVTPVIQDGVILYRIPEGFAGVDSFTYTISDGELEASATVTVTVKAVLTVSGLIGEVVSGTGAVSVLVGGEAHPASLDGNRYSVDLTDPAADDVIAVSATFSGTDIGKSITLKSYAGLISDLEAAASRGKVTEAEKATLYLSAVSTSVAAMLERSAGQEITSAESLRQSSQLIPQNVVMEGAVAIKSLLAGDSWDTLTQNDTYELLQEYPAAIKIAQALWETDLAKYRAYEAAIIGDANQALADADFVQSELVFVVGVPFQNKPSGFALQVSEGPSGTGYLTDFDLAKSDDNSVTFTRTGSEITVDVEGLFISRPYYYVEAEGCEPDAYGAYNGTPIKRVLKKYLDSAAFTSYAIKDVVRCDGSMVTFETNYFFAQLNHSTSGNIEALAQGKFAVNSYLEKDPAVYGGSSKWQAVVVQPNAEGRVTQRFDFDSGYTDNGALEFLDNGRMALDMDRGDYVEYVPLGMDGAGLRVLGVLKRADGSVAAANGSFLVPYTDAVSLPVPGKLIWSDSVFAINDPDISWYYGGGFGLEFLADGIGNDLIFSGPNGTYQASSFSKFSWSPADGYLDLRYYLSETDGYVASCAEGDPACVEHRIREVEPLAESNGEFYIRVYQKYDHSAAAGAEPGTEVSTYSYIDRFSVLP